MDAASIDPEELKIFLQEADEQIQLLDEEIIRLEREADNVDLLQSIFRAAHTLKGSSGMLGLQRMADLTHAMEDVLDRVRKQTLPVTPELVDALLTSLDGLKVLKGGLNSGEEGALEIAPLVAGLRALDQPAGDVVGEDEAAAASIEAAAVTDDSAMEELEAARKAGLNLQVVRATLDKGSEWLAVRCFQIISDLSGAGQIILSMPNQEEIEQEKVASELQLILATQESEAPIRSLVEAIEDVQKVEIVPWQEPDPAAQPDEREADGGGPKGDDRRVINLGQEARGAGQQEQLEMAAQKIETLQTIRIDVDRLDGLMNLVGEMVIDKTRVIQVIRLLQTRYKEDDLIQALADTSAHIERVVDDLSEDMMQVRMLPIGTLFSKFPRLVRDIARSTGKEIEFVTDGEDTEIDRTIIERIKDPLVHLLRNAVDHGIEPPETRKAAGKQLPALVRLSAYHEQGHIIIKLEDDGKGIDAEQIKKSAVKKGALKADAAARMSEAEAIDLIFESGLSTAQTITDVSGRGVGMDVVKRSITALNGLIRVDTKVGVGSTFTMQLPLTLASFPGLLVQSQDAIYAMPLSYVQETGTLENDSIETIMDTEVVKLRGDVLPLIRLSDACGTRSKNGNGAGEGFIVVVKAGERPLALAVDALMEQQEIVVKSLGDYIGQTEGVAGASILGDGRVVLILDVGSLVVRASREQTAASGGERRAS